MNFQDNLNKLRQNKRKVAKNINSLKEEIKEREEAIQSIKSTYKIKKDQYENEFKLSVEKIHNYCKKIEKYSTFNRDDMSYILAEIASIYEGKKYIVAGLSYHPENTSPACVQDVLVIIEEENLEKINATNHLSERYLHHLLKNRKIVMLDSKFSLCKIDTLTFYKYETGTVNQNISFNSYQYLKDFIDFVINYRLEYNKEYITEEELQNLKQEFIISNQEIIENQLEFNAENAIANYKKQIIKDLEHNKKLLKRIINKSK